MRLIKFVILSFSILCMSNVSSIAEETRNIDGAEGIWLTKKGKSHLKIIECGDDLCNEIIWLRQPNDKKGRPHTDKLNKIKSLRTRPIMGLSILSNMKRVKKGIWVGRIYDPERGKSFKAKVKLLGKSKLQVRGCLPLGPPFCKTHIWNKVRDLTEEDHNNEVDKETKAI